MSEKQESETIKERDYIRKPFTSMQMDIDELELENRRLRRLLRQAKLMIERLSLEIKEAGGK